MKSWILFSLLLFVINFSYGQDSDGKERINTIVNKINLKKGYYLQVTRDTSFQHELSAELYTVKEQFIFYRTKEGQIEKIDRKLIYDNWNIYTTIYYSSQKPIKYVQKGVYLDEVIEDFEIYYENDISILTSQYSFGTNTKFIPDTEAFLQIAYKYLNLK